MTFQNIYKWREWHNMLFLCLSPSFHSYQLQSNHLEHYTPSFPSYASCNFICETIDILLNQLVKLKKDLEQKAD